MFSHIATTTISTSRPRTAWRPRRADDVELIGEYKDSGYREPPYIVRRGGGVVQLTRLLYLVLEAADGTRTVDEIAESVSEFYGRGLRGRDVNFLLEKKLAPIGLLEGGVPPKRRPGPLELTTRAGVVPENVVRTLAALFRPLFSPFIVGLVLAWLVVLDVWLFRHHGIGAGIVQILRSPVLALLVLGLLLLSTVFHEIGHAAACRYGGARPGVMGIGFYLVWPAFYTDVTDAYRLGRRGRLRTDLGGVYFNCVFVVGLAGLYFWTHFEPLLVAIAIQHVQILNQFMPWARLDGYYVLTDLTGVPDILSRIKPILLSLVPDREPDPRVAELKPWVRFAVTIYVITFVLASAFVVVLLVWMLPRYAGTAARAYDRQAALITAAHDRHDLASMGLGIVQLTILLFPFIGITLGVVRITKKTAHTVRTHPRLRLLAGLAAAAILGGLISIAAASGPAGAKDRWATQGHPAPAENGQVARRTPRAHPAAPTTQQTQPTPPATPMSAAGQAPTSQVPATATPATAQSMTAQTAPTAPAAAPGAGAVPPPTPPTAPAAAPTAPQTPVSGGAPAHPPAPPPTAPPPAPPPTAPPPAPPPTAPPAAPPPAPATGVASGLTTTITASPSSVDADGSSTATVTVQAKDSSGRNLTASGGRVVLTTTLGSLGPVRNNDDGTYVAALASADPGIARVTGTIAGRAISDDASVEFLPLESTTGDGTTTTTSTTTN